MKTTALIAAGGAGRRMGTGQPKAFLLLEGRSLLAWSVSLFEQHAGVDAIVVMAPAAMLAAARVSAADFPKVIAVEPGGPRRQDTVALGLAAIEKRGAAPDDLVLVHDSARPLATPALVSAVIEAARRTGAAVPGLTPADTVKRVRQGRVTATLDRAELALIQTPQGFRLSLLQKAVRRHAALEVTDDASLVEALGHPIELVPGDPTNIKVTNPGDLGLAACLLRARDEAGGGR